MNKVEKTLLSFQSVMINPECTFSLPARCEPYLHPALYSSTPYSQSVRVIVCVIFLSLKLRLFSIWTSTWMFVCENLFTIKEKTVWCEVCIFNAKPAWFEPPQRWHVFNGSCWRQRPPEDHFTSIKLLCVLTSLHCWLRSALFALTAASIVFSLSWKTLNLISCFTIFTILISALLLQPREKGRMRFHRLQNVQIALDFLKQRQVSSHVDTHSICLHHPSEW